MDAGPSLKPFLSLQRAGDGEGSMSLMTENSSGRMLRVTGWKSFLA